MAAEKQTYDLRPDWRIFLLPYIAGVLLAPLLGLGIWIIFHYRKRWLGMQYFISNSGVTLRDGEMETSVALQDIGTCEVIHKGVPGWFGLGSIRIHHTSGMLEMQGISDAGPVASLIEQAAEAERDRLKIRQEAEQTRPVHPSGTLDPMNELVGLWQQGLISEEDYHREMKKYEPR